MNLKTNELERYSRQIIIKDIGITGQKKIKNSKVLIVGLGGLGCPVAEYLSRTGVGTIGLIDHDKIDLSNIHRQSMFTTKDVGKFKVKVVSDRVKKINPNVKIENYKKKTDIYALGMSFLRLVLLLQEDKIRDLNEKKN